MKKKNGLILLAISIVAVILIIGSIIFNLPNVTEFVDKEDLPDRDYEIRIGGSTKEFISSGDFDNDGKKEIIFINRTSYTSGWCGTPSYFDKIECFEYNKSGNYIEKEWESPEVGPLSKLIIVDMDLDNNYELIYSCSGILFIYSWRLENKIGQISNFSNIHRVSEFGYSLGKEPDEMVRPATISDFFVADIDNEGELEIIIGASSYLSYLGWEGDKASIYICKYPNLEEYKSWNCDKDCKINQLFQNEQDEIVAHTFTYSYYWDSNFYFFNEYLYLEKVTDTYEEIQFNFSYDYNNDSISDIIAITNQYKRTVSGEYHSQVLIINGASKSTINESELFNFNIYSAILVNESLIITTIISDMWNNVSAYSLKTLNIFNFSINNIETFNQIHTIHKAPFSKDIKNNRMLLSSKDGSFSFLNYDLKKVCSGKLTGLIEGLDLLNLNDDEYFEYILTIHLENYYEYNTNMILVDMDLKIIPFK